MVSGNSPEANKYFNRIFTASERAEQLIKHFLNFSRCVKENEQMVSLRDIIQETVTLLDTTIPAGINLQQKIDDDVDEIKANPIMVYEIVMNLVKNAADALKDTTGTITVSLQMKHCRKITVMASPPDHMSDSSA